MYKASKAKKESNVFILFLKRDFTENIVKNQEEKQMSRKLKTMICCILALVFVSGTVIAVLADSENLTAAESESMTDVEETTVEDTTDVDETTTEAASEDTSEEVVEIVYGDLNGDGEITAADARIVLRASAQLETLTDAQKIAADVVKDGEIHANDARRILRLSAQLISAEELVSEVA